MTEEVTVLFNTLYAGISGKLDKPNSKPAVPGGFASMPAQMNHLTWTKLPTVMQAKADGPFAFYDVNPADDPPATH